MSRVLELPRTWIRDVDALAPHDLEREYDLVTGQVQSHPRRDAHVRVAAVLVVGLECLAILFDARPGERRAGPAGEQCAIGVGGAHQVALEVDLAERESRTLIDRDRDMHELHVPRQSLRGSIDPDVRVAAIEVQRGQHHDVALGHERHAVRYTATRIPFDRLSDRQCPQPLDVDGDARQLEHRDNVPSDLARCSPSGSSLKDSRLRAAVRPLTFTLYYRLVLVRPHLSIAGTRRSHVTKPDLSVVEDIVAPRVVGAMRTTSRLLTELGVRHVVVGGLAVGANGYPRATKDVDFLVSDDAFLTKAGGIVLLAPGIPFQVDGVAVDYLVANADEAHLAEALEGCFGGAIDAPRLIYMKLKANRLRDQLDVVELVKAGVDRDACRSYLAAHARDLVELFDRYARQAAAEQANE